MNKNYENLMDFKALLNLLKSQEQKLFNNNKTVELYFKYETNYLIWKKWINLIGKVIVDISNWLNKYKFQVNFLPEIINLFLKFNSKKELKDKIENLQINKILNLKETEDLLFNKLNNLFNNLKGVEEKLKFDNIPSIELQESFDSKDILKNVKNENKSFSLIKDVINWDSYNCDKEQFIPLFYYNYNYSWSYDYTDLYSILGLNIIKHSHLNDPNKIEIEFVFNIANIYHQRKTGLWRMDVKQLSWDKRHYPNIISPFYSVCFQIDKTKDYKIFETSKELNNLFTNFKNIAKSQFSQIKPKWNPWIGKLQDCSLFYEWLNDWRYKNEITIEEAKKIIEKRIKKIASFYI